MMALDLATVDHLLTTTRSVRKRLDFDRPVDLDVVYECLEIAIQAPSGSNRQGWRFVIVTDADKRSAIADHYRRAFDEYLVQVRRSTNRPAEDDPRAMRAERVLDSATYLAQNMHRVPVLIIPCIVGRVEDQPPVALAALYGSILPATWSLMLALRARGLGAAWTTLHLVYEQEVAQLLQIPTNITQAALLPVAYFTGEDFRPAKRIPARQLTYLNTWSS
jgi:nitroreductase